MPYSHHLSLSSKDWDEQIDRIPRLLNIARITVVASLLLFHLTASYSGINELKKITASLPFYSWVCIYLMLITLTFYRPDWQRQERHNKPNFAATADITMIMAFVYLSGGISTGFGILVLPFVAASCLLSRGRYPWLYAGYTSVLVLGMMRLKGQLTTDWDDLDGKLFTAMLMLVGAVFVVAYLTAYTAARLKDATRAASESRLAFDRVSGLNSLVLDRVQEAVIVIDQETRVWLFNQRAKAYFPLLTADRQEPLFEELVKRWQFHPSRPFETDAHLHQYSMRVRALPLIQQDTQLLMLFARSVREVTAEAMATKLASLGQLTANLAHEMRNPMSAIRHANGLLQDGAEESDPVAAKLHGIIDSNIARIDKMLEDISSLNKRDKNGREPVDLMKFWLAFKQEFLLNNRDALNCIRMKMDGRMIAVVDPMHLQQIMWNLCNNAWRHSRHDEQAVTVSIRPSGRLHISILVADNGNGVPPELCHRLLEPFFTTAAQGTGLGLYVARELAHANLGQLHYHPERNGFELILPRDESHEIQ